MYHGMGDISLSNIWEAGAKGAEQAFQQILPAAQAEIGRQRRSRKGRGRARKPRFQPVEHTGLRRVIVCAHACAGTRVRWVCGSICPSRFRPSL